MPSARLDDAMRSLEARARNVEAREVRGDDLDAQRANLTATRERLLALLEKSTRAEDALAVKKGVSEVQLELEKVAGRIKYLQQAAALSTVTATCSPQRGAREWRPLEVAHTSASVLLAVLQLIGSALIVALVFWGPLAWFLRRKKHAPAT